MADIRVEPQAANRYRVTVTDERGSSIHAVKVSTGQASQLGGGASAQDLVEESFRFLLERESKESILRDFDLSVIADYFPEYPQEIRLRLGGTVG
jgi:hypothetical protein